MTRIRLGAAPLALALLAAAPPVRACDPEAMNQEIAAICRAALDPAAEIARAVLPRATTEEARAIEAAILAARDACDVGDPAAGARQAVAIARLAGRIEARAHHPL
jgi:hypothetical protein